ncbi:MAG TPA: phosphotransferase [Ignavibacteriaceae bacterium]
MSVGSCIQNYKIERQMSRGGFSWVYRALAPDAKPVFIKEFFPHSCTARSSLGGHLPLQDKEAQYKEALRRFIDEARLLASFRSAGYPRLRHFLWQNEIPYMIFEWERGRTLSQYLQVKKNKIPEQLIRIYLAGFLRLLRKMHSEQILHLDLHPGNLFFRLDGKPVILDFGCAKHIGDLSLFSGPIRMYTHGFTPPEIIQKGGMIGPWSDLYMLGGCLRACGILDTKNQYSQDLFTLTSAFLRKNPLDRPKSIEDPLVISFLTPPSVSENGMS